MMTKSELKVVFYETQGGNQVVLEAIRVLGSDDKKQVGEDITVAAWRFPLGAPIVKPLGAGLYEVRSSITSGREFRCLFGVIGKPAVIFVVDAFVKKTQRTPKDRLDQARRRLEAYEPS